MIHRRVFLKDGGLAVVGLSTVPGFLRRAAMAATTDHSRKKTLVVIFQRGGADGLNIVVPFGDESYYKHRPTIAIAAPKKDDDTSAIDLDGFYGLHPALKPLAPLYKKGHFGIINAVGSPNTGDRSHFRAQDFMESAAPGNHALSTGWVNRFLRSNPSSDPTVFRATSLGVVLPKSLRGPASTMALGNLAQFELNAGGGLFKSQYSQDSNTLLTGTAREMFDGADLLKKANPRQYKPANGANYRQTGTFGPNLQQVAQLIKADIGVQVACVDIGGWDTHSNQLERHTTLLGQYGRALAAFNKDMGDRMEDVVVLTMSEFGRTTRENGSRGTDHGHANMMFVMGGKVNGGKVYGHWPGLKPEQLNEDRDLALTTDFRDVFAELLTDHLGAENLQAVFPGHTIDAERFKGLA